MSGFIQNKTDFVKFEGTLTTATEIFGESFKECTLSRVLCRFVFCVLFVCFLSRNVSLVKHNCEGRRSCSSLNDILWSTRRFRFFSIKTKGIYWQRFHYISTCVKCSTAYVSLRKTYPSAESITKLFGQKTFNNFDLLVSLRVSNNGLKPSR